MEWEATDQFGNLYIGESNAKSVEELSHHLRMLIAEVLERTGGEFTLTLDYECSEITGPFPENVSHILRVPWIASQPQKRVQDLIDLTVEAWSSN